MPISDYLLAALLATGFGAPVAANITLTGDVITQPAGGVEGVQEGEKKTEKRIGSNKADAFTIKQSGKRLNHTRHKVAKRRPSTGSKGAQGGKTRHSGGGKGINHPKKEGSK